MALSKEIKFSNGVVCSYHKVREVRTEPGVSNFIIVDSYVSEESRNIQKGRAKSPFTTVQQYYYESRFEAPYDPHMTIEIAYEWVRENIPEYAGATDLVGEDSTPLAYAMAVENGSIERDDVPGYINFDGIEIAESLPQKEGFVIKRIIEPVGYRISYEYVSDPNYKPDVADGTYTKPFTFEPGMTVTLGMWYTDGEDIWECIEDGTAESFTAPWFDVIEV